MQVESCGAVGSLKRNMWNRRGTMAEPWEALGETQNDADGTVWNRERNRAVREEAPREMLDSCGRGTF